MQIWMICSMFLCVFSLRCPRIVDSARSAQHSVREGFMAISNLLGIDSIFDMPISNLVMFDSSHRAAPLGMRLSRSSDLGNAVFASTRGSTRLGKCRSLWFANSYVTSMHAVPTHRGCHPFDRLLFPAPEPSVKKKPSICSLARARQLVPISIFRRHCFVMRL
jgi:hypothetical protein